MVKEPTVNHDRKHLDCIFKAAWDDFGSEFKQSIVT